MSVLSAESLAVLTADGTPLLSDISISIEASHTTLLCGASGSGKTLLAKALRGLLADRTDLDIRGQIRREGPVGFVFQRPARQLVRRTVRNDIAFGLENRGLPIDEIEERISRHAANLEVETLLDRPIRELSGGEQTIVAILGVLVTEPPVIILDEPFSALDFPNTQLVLEALDRLREQETALLIAEHDVRDLLSRADRVVVLEDGRITGNGEPRTQVTTLATAGVNLPFDTVVAAELGYPSEAIPLGTTDWEVEAR